MPLRQRSENSHDRSHRLKTQGDWEEFGKWRLAFQGQGLSSKKSYVAASWLFPHPDEPAEIIAESNRRRLMAENREVPPDDTEAAVSPVSEPESDSDQNGVVSSGPDMGRMLSDREICRDLAQEALGREATGNAIITWVLDRIEIPWHTIAKDPDSVPSPAAVTMLRMAKVSDSGVLELMTRGGWVKGSVSKVELVEDDVPEPEVALDGLLAKLEAAGVPAS